jgi:hypothetical protein
MINKDRIVPITAIDLITMYGLVLALAADTAPTKLDAIDTAGDFEQDTNSATILCSEPVKSFGFGNGVTAGTVYFVPAYDYSGFSINGAAATTAGATVDPDGRTLYSATLADGAVTIAKVGF